MELWPAEYEGLRAEARYVAQQVIDQALADLGRPPTELGARVQYQREMLSRREIEAMGGKDEDIAGVGCRVFRPNQPTRGVYLHLHGGGLIAGTPRMSDPANSHLCQHLGVVVVSADYRLAPENPYPAAPDDAFAVACWLIDNAKAELGSARLLIGGESAGAYLSVLTLLRVRDLLGTTERFAAANLLYAGYDLSGTPSQRGARPTDAPDILDPQALKFIGDCFLPRTPDVERQDARISPLYADLTGLPPALFTVGSADHLLDDSILLAARWAAAGSRAELAVYPDCPHGFVRAPTQLARLASERINTFLSEALAA